MKMDTAKTEKHRNNIEIIHQKQNDGSKKITRIVYDRRLTKGTSRLWKMTKLIFCIGIVLLMLIMQDTTIARAGEKMKDDNLSDKNWSAKKSIQLNKTGLKNISDRKYDDAIKKFNEAIKIRPDDSALYCNKGLAYLYKREDEKALNDFNRAIKLNPDLVSAYNNRGIAYYLMTKYDKAIADFDKAIEIDGKFVKAYINRGLVYCDKKEYKEAIGDFNTAIKLDPKSWMAYNNRGLTYHLKGNEKKGIADVNKSLEIHPRFRVSFYGRDIAYSCCKYPSQVKKK